MALIGVALPDAAPLATPVEVGVLSLCPAISADWPAHDWPPSPPESTKCSHRE
jgi:hypothetical protein